VTGGGSEVSKQVRTDSCLYLSKEDVPIHYPTTILRQDNLNLGNAGIRVNRKITYFLTVR